MRHRLGASALAVLGGLLVVAAVLTPSWWEGPIHIAGRVIHGKTVHISMLRTTGCNSGDGTCMGLDVSLAFRAAGLVTLLLALATAAFSGLLAWKTWRRAFNATTYARFALLGSGVTVMGSAVFIALLPDRFEEIAVGLSPYGFFTGTAAMALASVLALRQQASSVRVVEEQVDVRELLSTDMLRPAMLGPEPKMGRNGAVLMDEPGYAARSGPRFRPLYEVQAEQAMQAQQQAQMQAMQAQQQMQMQGGYAMPPSGQFSAMAPSGAFTPIAPMPGMPPSGQYAAMPPMPAMPPSGQYAAPGMPPMPPMSGMPPSGQYAAPGMPPMQGMPPSGLFPEMPPGAQLPLANGSYGPPGAPVSGGYPAAMMQQPMPPHGSPGHATNGMSPPGVAPAPMDSADFLRANPMDSANAMAASASMSLPAAPPEEEDELDPSDAMETASLVPVTDRADALPSDASEPMWRVDPPELPEGAVVPARAASEADPGFDQPTTPSQMSMAVMLAQQAEAASGRQPTEVSDALASLEAQEADEEKAARAAQGQSVSGEIGGGRSEYESLDEDLEEVRAGTSGGETSVERSGEGEADDGRDSRVGENDSGVFFRKESAASVARAPISRPPTATTSASLAALAALSKPALITMAPSVARKMPPSKGVEPAVAAAVAVAVAPDVASAGGASGPVGMGAAAGSGDAAAATPACPNCEAPMAWAEKHLRYFCGACRMYF